MKLNELWPDLTWEQRRANLWRAEEDTPADNDGIDQPPHWRYALTKDDAVASMMVVKNLVHTAVDEDGIAEQLAQYHAIGRVK
jgi:hypothetical protein